MDVENIATRERAKRRIARMEEQATSVLLDTFEPRSPLLMVLRDAFRALEEKIDRELVPTEEQRLVATALSEIRRLDTGGKADLLRVVSDIRDLYQRGAANGVGFTLLTGKTVQHLPTEGVCGLLHQNVLLFSLVEALADSLETVAGYYDHEGGNPVEWTDQVREVRGLLRAIRVRIPRSTSGGTDGQDDRTS